MMTTAPRERRQQSKQTLSAAIPGGNKSGTGVFGWLFALSIWGFRMLSIGREESQGSVWEGRKGRSVGSLSTRWGHRAGDSRVG